MNYLTEIKAFHDLVQIKQLSTGQIALWYALMYINNKCAWIEWFSVSNLTLQLNTGLSRSGIKKARNSLKQLGIIDFKDNGTKSSSYKLITMSKSSQVGSQDSSQDGSQVGVQDGSQIGSRLNKLNETKLNNTSSKSDEEKETLLRHFDIMWSEYPNKKGKAKALEFYLQWIKGRRISGITRRLTDLQMYYAVKSYAKECEEKCVEQQFIKHGDTFFNKAILDYVEEENE